MIEVMIRSMLGEAGGAALDWLRGHPEVTTAVLGLLLTVYLLGRFQLRRIEQHTAQLVLDASREWLSKKPNITAAGLYKRIYPRWSEAVRDWGLFIPHRLEIWPVRVSPQSVRDKLSFSPQWIAALLAKHGLPLQAKEDPARDEG